jgi:hypothetical protein
LVDNGSSMAKYWVFARHLVSLLVALIYDQDDDGMELYFTSSKEPIRKLREPREFVDAMNKMRPRSESEKHNDSLPNIAETIYRSATGFTASEPTITGDAHSSHADDIRYTLVHILQRWQEDYKRKLTLIVFTDGVWKDVKEKKTVADNLIVQLSTWQDRDELKTKLKDRDLTIQFVQFGDNSEATKLFKWMDDELGNNNKKFDL